LPQAIPASTLPASPGPLAECKASLWDPMDCRCRVRRSGFAASAEIESRLQSAARTAAMPSSTLRRVFMKRRSRPLAMPIRTLFSSISRRAPAFAQIWSCKRMRLRLPRQQPHRGLLHRPLPPFRNEASLPAWGMPTWMTGQWIPTALRLLPNRLGEERPAP